MHVSGTVTWLGLTYGFVVLAILISFVVIKFWPRDEKGKLMNPEEAEKAIGKFKSGDDSGGGKKTMMVFILIIVTFALALSKHLGDAETITHDD